ncbi:MAG: tetratricopeptide repeat protein [Myxococcales bacterium]|nr:tetratricopeptide repeat protein [Myxococcales bacterium]
MNKTQFCAAALLVSLLAHGPAAAKSKLDAARDLLVSGKYPAAEKAFRKLGATGRAGLAQVLLETGRYEKAARVGKQARGKQRAAALASAAWALHELGRTQQAIALLKPLAKRRKAFVARITLAQLYHRTGQQALAKSIFDGFYDDYGNGKIDKKSAAQLTYVAIACRYTDNFRDASDTFGDAVKADGRFFLASLHWAEISLEKYEAGYAEKHYNRVLKVNPNHAEALVGMANTILTQSNNVRKAERMLERALKTNPNSIDARVVQAQILADNEQHREAEALLAKALKKNPKHLRALTVLAASHFLRDDNAGFRKLQRQIFAINKRYSAFYRLVMMLARRHHRYAETIKLGKEALKRNPEDYYSMAAMGTNYLRLGDDKKGVEWLKKSWAGDKYNVRAYNLLNLFDDVISKHYVFVRTKHFRLRVHKDEAKVIKRLVEPVLERAYGVYVKKYKFRPKHPITVEFFQDPSHYAVRTIGLPGLSALGVCFGPVITTTSPLLGRFNWGQVLWHELNHVFTIQITRSRVPRWLTEGLADLEPTLINSWWKRENDFDIYKALRSGRLHGLASMNSAFTRARSLHDMVVAYYQGSLMAAYLVKRWGMNKMLAALKAYGRGQTTAQILPRITGLSLAELDKQFRQHELSRLSFYNKNWYVDIGAYRDLPKYREAAQKRPKDGKAQAAYALSLRMHGKIRAAKAAAAAAQQLLPNDPLVLYVAAQMPELKPREREALLAKILKRGIDSYQVRLALGRAALARKDLKTAAKHLDRAKVLDPERGHPYYLLARAYQNAKRDVDAIRELKKLAALQQQSFGPIARLVVMLSKRNDWAGVRKYGAKAYYINPGSASLHTYLAKAFMQKAPRLALSRAKWHLDTALMTKPQKKSIVAELHVALAELYLLKHDKRRARQHFNKAKAADPDLPELSKLQSRL